jgi:hypothetical protein
MATFHHFANGLNYKKITDFDAIAICIMRRPASGSFTLFGRNYFV